MDDNTNESNKNRLMTKPKETEPSASLQTWILIRFPLVLSQGGQFLPPHKSLQVPKCLDISCLVPVRAAAEIGK